MDSEKVGWLRELINVMQEGGSVGVCVVLAIAIVWIIRLWRRDVKEHSTSLVAVITEVSKALTTSSVSIKDSQTTLDKAIALFERHGEYRAEVLAELRETKKSLQEVRESYVRLQEITRKCEKIANYHPRTTALQSPDDTGSKG